jgi:hypothetical protein
VAECKTGGISQSPFSAVEIGTAGGGSGPERHLATFGSSLSHATSFWSSDATSDPPSSSDSDFVNDVGEGQVPK